MSEFYSLNSQTSIRLVKCITMALEQPTVIDRILVVPILSNLQFSTKVPKFGILSQHQLPAHPASLALRKKYIRVFNKIRFGLKPHTRSTKIYGFIFIRGGLSYNPGGFSRSPRHVDFINL